MSANILVTQKAPALERSAARLSLAVTVLFLVLLLALHIIEPQFAPSWRMVSEYANGDYGWVMRCAFLALSLSCVMLFVAIRRYIHTVSGHIGLGFLLIVAAAQILAAINNMDPLTIKLPTMQGNLHALSALIGVPGFPVAALLISFSLARNAEWSVIRCRLYWATHLNWVCVVVLILVVAIMLPRAGGFGPEVWTGWANRLVIVAESAWLLTVSWHAIKLSKQAS